MSRRCLCGRKTCGPNTIRRRTEWLYLANLAIWFTIGALLATLIIQL